jgi:hypothetical protein
MLMEYRFKAFTDWARDRTEKKEVLLPDSTGIMTMRGYERQPPKNSKTNQHFLSTSNIHVKFITDETTHTKIKRTPKTKTQSQINL